VKPFATLDTKYVTTVTMNMAAASATERILAMYQTIRLHISAVCNITERAPQKLVIL
jgi:hypothetical protein